jgi:hypothetical protein
MKLKIFKATVYITILILSINGYAKGQDLSRRQEKELEAKMKQMELKLNKMQAKLDSLKATQKSSKFNALTSTNAQITKLETLKNLNQTLALTFSGAGESIGEAFSGLDKSFNFNFNYPDQKLEERIKSGDVKEKVKNYSKSYSIGSGDKLQIDNRYGKVIVNTWAKNEFKVDVEIKVAADEDDEAQKLLDGVSISDSKDGNVVSFMTNINNKGNNSWSMWGGNSRSSVHKVEVNYTIYMPTKNALDITNRYGGTVLPDFAGKLTINSSYGSFTAKTLTNGNNNITSRYGSATIESLNGSDLNIAYGSLILGSSDNLNAQISYSSAKIDRIKTSGNITVKYSGGLKIGDLDKNFKNLSINSSYSSVIMGLSGDQNFDFDVTVRYGSFNYGDHSVNLTGKTPGDDERGWNPTKNYKGHLGKGNADKVVTISSSYGSVKFN